MKPIRLYSGLVTRVRLKLFQGPERFTARQKLSMQTVLHQMYASSKIQFCQDENKCRLCNRGAYKCCDPFSL